MKTTLNLKKSKWNATLSLVLSSTALLMALSGCSSAESPSSTSSNSSSNTGSGQTATLSGGDSVLTMGCTNFSDTLDPSANPNSAWGTARYGIGEPLFQFDAEMNAAPNLATGYEVDDSKTVWTLTIREGVQFSNGKDLTPTTVKASLDYLYAQEATGLVTNTPSQFLSVDTIVADDEAMTLTITTTKPYVDVSKILSHVNFVILDVESGDIANSPVGTGPYWVVDNQVGVKITLEANEYYWKGEVPFSGLEMVFMDDSTTKSLALQAGDIDMVDSITTANDLALLKSSSDFNVAETLSARTAFSYINYEGVLGNDDLREAVLLAVDDETICDLTVGGVYGAGYTILPTTLDYGSEELEDKTPYNLELAQEILDSAGIVDTDGDGIRELDGENITLEYVGYVSKSLDTVAQAVMLNLAELGIAVDLKVLDSDTHWNMIVNSAFDLGICSWITVPVGDPVGFLENWYGQGTMNYGNYDSAEYDRIYAELLEELDVDRQRELIMELQQILIDDCAVMIHGYYVSNLSSSNAIEGVEMSVAETYWITTNIKPAE